MFSEISMAASSDIKNQNKSRRRKKRRTQDSSSESSSESEIPSETENKIAIPKANGVSSLPNRDIPQNINIDDILMESDNEDTEPILTASLPADTLKQMEAVNFTITDNQTISEARDTVGKDRQQLETAFLALMATTFASELDELRRKPDFTDKSIVLLAKTLQSGSNMFDDETLDVLLKD